jgi:hypothetical protein
MRRQLKENLPRPYPIGYMAPSTGDVNIEPPRFLVGGGQDPGKIVGPDFMPPILILRARIMPLLRHHDGSVMAKFIKDSKAFSTISVYSTETSIARHGQHQSIELDYVGVGQIQCPETGQMIPFAGNTFLGLALEKTTLFVKTFLSQETGTVTLTHVNSGYNRYMVYPSGLENAYPLWGYGGYYRSGIPLTQIEQIFFTITQKNTQTAVYLTPLSFWKEKGIFPPLGGKNGPETVVYIDENALIVTRSLGGDIEAGEVSISMSYGVDERGKKLNITYKSFRYDQKEEFVDITFKKEGI